MLPKTSTPPASSSDRRVKSFNYIEAIKELPTNFTKEELSTIRKQIPEKLFGQLRAIFVVISDDVIKKRSFKSGNTKAKSADQSEASKDVPAQPGQTGRVNHKRPNSSPDSGASGKHKK